MKIATWNVNSLKVRLPHVLDWLASESPDVLALQETKLTDENFPAAALGEAGFHVAFAGQKTYNGVALITSNEATDVITDVDDLEDPSRRIISATVDGVRVLNLYVVNGQEVGSEKYEHKLYWLRQVERHIGHEMREHPNFVVVGDFNIAPRDQDVHDPQAWREKILCSTPERERLADIMQHGLVDSFRLFDQPEASFSWWDYRAAGFRRNLGLRIDLILASNPLAERCQRCWIDKAPRKLERPSDHTPVVAEFDI